MSTNPPEPDPGGQGFAPDPWAAPSFAPAEPSATTPQSAAPADAPAPQQSSPPATGSFRRQPTEQGPWPPAGAAGPASAPTAQMHGPPPVAAGGPVPAPSVYGPPQGAPGYGPATPGYPGAEPMPPGQLWAPQYPYASWWNRVVAFLIDFAYSLPPYLLMVVGIVIAALNVPTYNRGIMVRPGNGSLVALGFVIAVIGFLGYLAVIIYNMLIVQGRTGQSWGKRHTGLRVIAEQTGQPLSIGMNFLRQLCHYLDSIAYIGYLWPLWDAKRQTFADKIMSTVVVRER